jgi:hypothetical protein
LDVFSRSIVLASYDIIVLGTLETWLRHEVSDCEPGLLPNYIIFRCDKCSVFNNVTRGGGVLIAVKNKYRCCRLTILNNNIEQLFVKLSIDSSVLLIGAIYIPPNFNINIYNDHTDTVNSLLCNYNNVKIIILGDFN